MEVSHHLFAPGRYLSKSYQLIKAWPFTSKRANGGLEKPLLASEQPSIFRRGGAPSICFPLAKDCL
jgi:hypothetical protein